MRVPNYWNQSRVLKRSGKRKYKFKGVRAKAWGESKIYEHTFIGNGSRGPTVYARIGKEQSKLKRPYGPSIRQQFKSRANIEKMKAFARPRFEKEMKNILYKDGIMLLEFGGMLQIDSIKSIFTSKNY